MAEAASGEARERRTLWVVLFLKLGISAAFFAVGVGGDSSALIANGVDNLSDALVYVLSLIALSRGAIWKTRAASASGVMLLMFAIGILVDVGRRYLYGSEPVGSAMMMMSALAAGVNYLCLRLLQRLKQPDVALRAATTFSFNDFISNGGILIAGALVLWLGTNWPDLIVGLATALIAIKGGVEILMDARAETRRRRSGPASLDDSAEAVDDRDTSSPQKKEELHDFQPRARPVLSCPVLSCPVCRVALVMSERQGVEIDHCPQCRGVWLDRGELDKIIERGAGESTRLSSPRVSYGHDRERYRTSHGGDHGRRRRKSFLEELFD